MKFWLKSFEWLLAYELLWMMFCLETVFLKSICSLHWLHLPHLIDSWLFINAFLQNPNLLMIYPSFSLSHSNASMGELIFLIKCKFYFTLPISNYHKYYLRATVVELQIALCYTFIFENQNKNLSHKYETMLVYYFLCI